MAPRDCPSCVTDGARDEVDIDIIDWLGLSLSAYEAVLKSMRFPLARMRE
jgi:hypothetical protein